MFKEPAIVAKVGSADLDRREGGDRDQRGGGERALYGVPVLEGRQGPEVQVPRSSRSPGIAPHDGQLGGARPEVSRAEDVLAVRGEGSRGRAELRPATVGAAHAAPATERTKTTG